ncbi:MAG: diguanylate cyclase [Gemmatimonadetes bacterium]|jgi:putative nucleotidyltransferase with HDIG domain|nr:diguanylate cyclase [Gemmatimonadota bacterium]
MLRTIPSAGNSTVTQIEDILVQGQSLERRGQREEARNLYELALHDGTAATAAEMAQLHRLIARAYLEDGSYAAADDSAHAALAISEQSGDEAGRGRAINTLAAICWAQGAHDEAQRLYLQARASALAVGEARLASMTASNLGVIATVRGDDRDALQYYESGLSDARGAGLVDEAMNALVNLGLLHTHMHRFSEADRAFAEAKDLGAVVGDLSRLIRIELHLARLRIKQGERDAARDACDRARDLAKQTGDTFADGDAEHVSGLIARMDGDVARSEAHFLSAEKIAIERKDLILQGETAKELAELYRWNGRNKDTLQRLNQAHRLYLQLRARRELADVDRRTASLEADFLDVVRKWGESIEEKDVYTQGHCVRVADLSCALWARVSAGDDTSLFWFRIGALLHDVGKLMVPAEVLNKPGKLTDDEWKLIQSHPSAGVELLADIDFPWDVRPIVESHHERWDGKGYPHKLAGEAIPLTARVLCIADVYDALTSKRSYKQAFTHDEAMEIMRGDVGRQFDPTLFAAFEEIVRRGTWRNTPAGGALVVST